MREAFPKKFKALPGGVTNIEGKLITNPKEKDRSILNHFNHRMRKRVGNHLEKTHLRKKQGSRLNSL